MDLWERVAALMLRLIDQHDDLAIFLWLLIEETGFPLPLPGDLAMILAGYRVAQGAMHPLWALFLLESATLVGGSALYWLGARGGRPLLLRYGRYVRLDRARLERTEAWLQRRPGLAIAIGRVTPGLRNVTVLAAGVFAVPYRTFLPAFAIGSFAYILFFFTLGLWGGPQVLDTIGTVRVSLRLILTAIVFVGLGAFLVVMYRRAALVRHLAREPAREMRKIETSVMAGLLATLLMGMGLNVLLYILTAIGIGPPEQTLIRFFQQGADRFAGGHIVRFIILVVAVLFASELLWAILYSHLPAAALRLPPWLRGVAFSVVPLAFSALVLLPALGAGPLGLHLEAGLVPLGGEALRNLLYGLGLATSYSLLRVARQRPARAAPDPVPEAAADGQSDQPDVTAMAPVEAGVPAERQDAGDDHHGPADGSTEEAVRVGPDGRDRLPDDGPQVRRQDGGPAW